jgi:pimeloyl-ACP methyl ester carboxylesterase
MHHRAHLDLTAFLISMLALFSITGCDTEVRTLSPPVDGPSTRVAWGEECPEGFQTECARVRMPLDWSDPEGETISVLVARQPASAAVSKAQLWLLAGGPGSSGSDFGSLLDELGKELPDYDLYVLEHRGLFWASSLYCEEQPEFLSEDGGVINEKEWAPCISSMKEDWGDGLVHFNATSDARDLQRLIELTRAPDQKVFLYGVSYGTYRAMRYLQIAPEGADGVILDSILTPDARFLSRFDENYDPVAQEFAKVCAADPVCNAKMGSDPWAAAEAIFDKLENGHCSALGELPRIKRFLAGLLQSDLRPHVFPALYRINRCDNADVEAIKRYMGLREGFYSLSGNYLGIHGRRCRHPWKLM